MITEEEVKEIAHEAFTQGWRYKDNPRVFSDFYDWWPKYKKRIDIEKEPTVRLTHFPSHPDHFNESC